MICHGRHLWACVPLLALFVTNALAQRPTTDADAMRQDAELTDVFFGNGQTGWAVGDRGVIWHTIDAGRNWNLQPTTVDCRLESICFISPKLGWAAGRTTTPYAHSTRGVVLQTQDGGRTWREQQRVLLPGLTQIRFFDNRRGVALGDSSAMYPSGVFTTDDGGRSWSNVPADRMQSWTAGDFSGPHSGILVGRQGALSVMWRRELRPSRTPSLGLRGVRSVQLVTPRDGWLVGDGGLVLRTADSGVTWQTPTRELPVKVAQQFDFHDVAARGSHCWIVGTPGTKVMYSGDDGQSWHGFSTGQPLPLRAVTFSDPQHGWAVGSLGTILATRDGGRTWRRQRGGGARAALLGLFGRPRDVPLALFTKLCGNEGYLGRVELLGREDVASVRPNSALAATRAHEALVGVGASGASGAWQFPLREEGLKLSAKKIVADLDQAHDGRGIALAEQHLVSRIRMWRPEVIVTHDADPNGDDPLDHLVNQLVLRAVEKAADETLYRDQLIHAGLAPWQTKKVFSSLPTDDSGTVTLSTSVLAPRLGGSLAERTAKLQGLVLDKYEAPPATMGFQLLVNRLGKQSSRRDFFHGILLQPGGDARRLLGEAPQHALDAQRRMAQLRRNLQQIMVRSKDNRFTGAQWLGQVDALTRPLNSASAGEIIYQLARQYHRQGRPELAAETMQLLVERYHQHPLAESALTWLVQYYASSENAWREQKKQQFGVQQAAFAQSTAASRTGQIVPTTAQVGRSLDDAKQNDRPGKAAAWGIRISKQRPALFARPEIRFPLAAAHRSQGLHQQAQRYILQTVRTRPHDAWWQCARAEQWLAEAKGVATKPIANAYRTATKPKLDGQLDDATWRGARPIAIQSASAQPGQSTATAMISYDDAFLYLAVRCPRAAGVKYAKSNSMRPRDPDLSDHDRVDLFLDLDRDYTTFYRLTIDHRGWVSEACWGDVSWNPKWFVAAGQDGQFWTAEAAIPLAELTGQHPKPRDVWALGIQRIIPGDEVQSWTQPAAVEPVGQGFGQLIFQ
jgi:photosystem II stability/assembly factor-like uncharacterized protein